MNRQYYQQIADGFDRAAGSYEADYTANPIMAWLEDDTYARLLALFPAGSRLDRGGLRDRADGRPARRGGP